MAVNPRGRIRSLQIVLVTTPVEAHSEYAAQEISRYRSQSCYNCHFDSSPY